MILGGTDPTPPGGYAMSRAMRKTLSIVALLLSFALVAAACGDDDDNTATGSSGTGSSSTTAKPATRAGNGVFELGTLLPQTGDLSVLGPPMIKAVEMAVRDIDAAGGVLGKNVKLTQTDDGTSEDVASASTDKLLNTDKVDVILGAAGSGITKSVIDKITGAGVV